MVLSDGLYLYRGAIVVPADNALRDALIYEAHDTAAGGHLGINATLRRLSGNFFWNHGDYTMNEHIDAYVRSCASCQCKKASNQKPGGLLQSLPVPDGPWSSISVDFVTGLPLTARGLDSIMVCVDRFTKMVHMVATRKDLTAPQCALLMFQHVIKHHGVPKDIVSDRDKLFTSAYWKELCQLLGTQQLLCLDRLGDVPWGYSSTTRAFRTIITTSGFREWVPWTFSKCGGGPGFDSCCENSF